MVFQPDSSPKKRVACLLGDTVGRARRSPIVEAAKALGDDAEVRNWFLAQYSADIAKLTSIRTNLGWKPFFPRRDGKCIWSDFDEKELKKVFADAVILETSYSDVIRSSIAPEKALYFAVSGSYAIGGCDLETSGRDYGPGDVIGMPACFGGQNLAADVVTIQPGEIAIVPTETLDRLRRRSPETFEKLRQAVKGRNRSSQQ